MAGSLQKKHFPTKKALIAGQNPIGLELWLMIEE